MERQVAHLDMDAFFASCEALRRPQLQGLPFVIAGSGPRAVVATASYEARARAGIHSAMPLSRARMLCPELVRVPPDFSYYRRLSGEVMSLVRAAAPAVEVMGLDEAYLELTGVEDAEAKLRALKDKIKAETGLTCSIGYSENRLLAKIASDLDKPDGFTLLTREQALERFAGSSPGLIPGIGPRTVERLEAILIRTLGELRAQRIERLQAVFGQRQGEFLWRRSRFEDFARVGGERAPKSKSSEETFDTDVEDLDQLEQTLERLAADLSERLAGRGLAGRTVGIKVRTADFATYTRERTIAHRTSDQSEIAALARELLRENQPALPVRLLGIRVASFTEPARPRVEQLALFE